MGSERSPYSIFDGAEYSPSNSDTGIVLIMIAVQLFEHPSSCNQSFFELGLVRVVLERIYAELGDRQSTAEFVYIQGAPVPTKVLAVPVYLIRKQTISSAAPSILIVCVSKLECSFCGIFHSKHEFAWLEYCPHMLECANAMRDEIILDFDRVLQLGLKRVEQ